MPTFLILLFTVPRVEGSVMAYCGGLVKSLGNATAPLLTRAVKLIEVGATPPDGVSSACGIASSTLSPLLETPKLSGAPPFSRVATPAEVTEYRKGSSTPFESGENCT